MNIPGVGPEAQVVVNEKGAKQSHVPYRADLFPPTAYLHVAGILAKGAETYGENTWVDISFADHINHALVHINAYGAGDRSDDHIGHAACRMMMALEVFLWRQEQEVRKAERPKFGF